MNCNICKIVLTKENRHTYTTNFLCKECINTYRRNLYKDSKSKYKSTKKKYTQTKHGKTVILNNTKKSLEKFPEKWKARQKVRYAVLTGKLKKEECSSRFYDGFCKGRIEAHHYLGYKDEHWKDIVWLCSKHHAEWHIAYRRIYL